MDVEPTIEVIDAAADTLERAGKELRARAAKMRETGDVTYAAEAINTAVNAFMNLRLDLFVMRPLRAAMNEPKTKATP